MKKWKVQRLYQTVLKIRGRDTLTNRFLNEQSNDLIILLSANHGWTINIRQCLSLPKMKVNQFKCTSTYHV